MASTSNAVEALPKVDSEQGQRVIALVAVLKRNPLISPEQIMNTFNWDRNILEQTLADMGAFLTFVEQHG